MCDMECVYVCVVCYVLLCMYEKYVFYVGRYAMLRMYVCCVYIGCVRMVWSGMYVRMLCCVCM